MNKIMNQDQHKLSETEVQTGRTSRPSKKKKMDPVVRMIVIMAIAAVIGGLVGGIFGFASGYFDFTSLGALAASLSAKWTHIQFWALLLLAIVSVATGEYFMRRLKSLGGQILSAQDEEADKLEFEEERIGAWAMSVNTIEQGLAILMLAPGYSLESAMTAGFTNFFGSCIVFLLCSVYLSTNQIRYVKLVKKHHPEKKGDPSSLRFQRDWLESCDEAEREAIYKSAYQVFLLNSNMAPILMFAAMLMHLIFQTGLLAIVIPLILWIANVLCYNKSVVALRRKSLS